MSFKSSILFKSTLIFVISEILRVISSSTSFNTVRYLYSISWISCFIFFVTLFISLCQASPCLFKASVNFVELWLMCTQQISQCKEGTTFFTNTVPHFGDSASGHGLKQLASNVSFKKMILI